VASKLPRKTTQNKVNFPTHGAAMFIKPACFLSFRNLVWVGVPLATLGCNVRMDIDEDGKLDFSTAFGAQGSRQSRILTRSLAAS